MTPLPIRKNLGRSRVPLGASRRSLLAACVTAALSLGLAAPAALAQGQPQRGGTVIAALDPDAIASFNTHLTSLTSMLFIADVWADGLMTYDRNGKRLPSLATEWTISPDGKVYTFKLRQGVKWSDGQPFSSADVLFTLNNFANFNTEESASRNAARANAYRQRND